METIYNNFIGPFIFFSLIISILFAFILPKTKLSKYFRINQTYFILTHICGIVSTILGLIAIFSFSPDFVKTYLWKILILPYAYLQIYTLYVMITRKTTQILDEKQEFNMANAGGVTLGLSIAIMGFIIIPLINNSVVDMKLLFPFYINAIILTFSLVTLYLFKKA